jgi:hypothetical protein
LARLIGDFSKEAGASCFFEQVVPELLQGDPGSDEAVEAKADVHIWAAAPQPLNIFVDVTQRLPTAKAYVRQAAAEDGWLNRTAEKEKEERYGQGNGGVHMLGVGIEAFGRLGPNFTSLLGTLANRMRAMGIAMVRIQQAEKRWRQDIGTHQVRSMYLQMRQAGWSPPAPKADDVTGAQIAANLRATQDLAPEVEQNLEDICQEAANTEGSEGTPRGKRPVDIVGTRKKHKNTTKSTPKVERQHTVAQAQTWRRTKCPP